MFKKTFTRWSIPAGWGLPTPQTLFNNVLITSAMELFQFPTFFFISTHFLFAYMLCSSL